LFIVDNYNRNEPLIIPIFVFLILLMFLETLEICDYSIVFLVLAVISIALQRYCTPVKYRILLIAPSLVYAYYLAEYNTFLALMPSFLFHSITIMHWKHYAVSSALEITTVYLSSSIFDSVAIWFVYGFLLCLLERTRKY